MIDEAAVRREKLQKLIERGIDPYPRDVQKHVSCEEILQAFEELSEKKKKVTLTGRLMTIRIHGAMIFADLMDASGKIQITLKEDEMEKQPFEAFRDLIDPADIIEATGTLFLTKRGEKTLAVSSWRLLTKTLLPLPEKWHGLKDVEIRYRKRYLDLLINSDVRQNMITRSKIISAIRELMDTRGCLEVETPTLQPLYGGGFARPFKTHHNALDTNFYLRISDELYLKRLIVGGFEGVYEITKVFRNEGIDHDHNPEFTMFEAQIAYQDYRFGMNLFEEIFEVAARKACGTTDILHGEEVIHLARPWKRFRMVEAIREFGGIDVSRWKEVEEAKGVLEKLLPKEKRGSMDHMHSLGEVVAFAFEELVEELIQPTLIYDYPVEVSPLAKKTADSRFTERFEAFALGSEIGNNYSELNDPLDLERRFIEEKKKEAAGFEEAHQTDTDYLEAIRHGFPPTCGLGIGIDRMVMLLTGAKNIKEVILFPTLRPEQS